MREQDAEIIDSMKDDAWHGNAPESIKPKHTFVNGPAAAATFLERRARTMSYVRDTDDPLREHTFPHPGVRTAGRASSGCSCWPTIRIVTSGRSSGRSEDVKT